MILTLCTHVINTCSSSAGGTLVGTGWDPLSSLFFMPDNVTQTPDTNKAAQARRLSEQSAYCAARSYLASFPSPKRRRKGPVSAVCACA